MSMTGIEAVLEQRSQLDLCAGSRPAIKIQIVNVNVAIAMQLGNIRIYHRLEIVFLRCIRSVLEHRSHSRIAINVGVISLQITLLR
jgi:hypothetical protein